MNQTMPVTIRKEDDTLCEIRICQKPPRSAYILYALNKQLKNGDAFVQDSELYNICQRCRNKLPYQVFLKDLEEQFRLGSITREGTRIYLTKTLRYETVAAYVVANILRDNDLPRPRLEDNEMVMLDGHTLSAEQQQGVEMALTHRLSIVLGGAGSGKTSLIAGLLDMDMVLSNSLVLCAPTGKAARNLSQRLGLPAQTVHSALGMCPDDDFLGPAVWERVELVIVDEASMMTLEMLAGILIKMNRNCRVVLLGDPNQLLSVGTGNVICDLMALGIPSFLLKQNHRQANAALALQNNVVHFSELSRMNELQFDSSFIMREMPDEAAAKVLVKEAAKRYLDGESIQVLSPCNCKGPLSVDQLNRAIQDRVNPSSPEKLELVHDGQVFRTGDRVMVTKNDKAHDCCNGDVGILCIECAEPENERYSILLSHYRCPDWEGMESLEYLTLAYAITVHKSQGGEVDTILMPMTRQFQRMMYRNLLYTAISRARKQVVLYGDSNALSAAVQITPCPRRSMLVAKTRMRMMKKASGLALPSGSDWA